MSELTRYGFRDVVSGFFEFPTENARRLLPAHLEPVELHHGTSVFSVTTFDFTESMVGPYGEVVLSVIVAPLVKAGERLPKSAFFPFQVGTTTRAAREHAIERWHLPHWMDDVGVEFDRQPGRLTVTVRADGEPALEMTVGEHSWQGVNHLYQCFMKDDAAYLARITMEGSQSEHEEETGQLRLFPHAFHGSLAVSEVAEAPFREIWMREGMQTFQPLQPLEIV
jgi:hypothetical protein